MQLLRTVRTFEQTNNTMDCKGALVAQLAIGHATEGCMEDHAWHKEEDGTVVARNSDALM